VESRKSAVSVRMGVADVRRVKAIARRLGVRDSDVFRYGVKSSLAQLAPLEDPKVCGRQLLPVFVEAPALVRYFELDAARLASIVNAGIIDPEQRVAHEDVALLSMASLQEPYALVRLGELLSGGAEMPKENASLLTILRDYLYGKYAFRQARRADAG
jgi:hypothetical protein